jgi:hypothetical protein
MNTISATLVRSDNSRSNGGISFVTPGAAALYKLDTPIKIGTSYRSKRKVPKERTTRYVWVSTSSVMGEIETYAFAAYSSGKVFGSELEGSQRGTSNHMKVLADMGITVR